MMDVDYQFTDGYVLRIGRHCGATLDAYTTLILMISFTLHVMVEFSMTPSMETWPFIHTEFFDERNLSLKSLGLGV